MFRRCIFKFVCYCHFLTVFQFLFELDMVHPNTFLKAIVSNDVKPDEVKDDVKPIEVNDDVRPVVVEINVGQPFINE